MSEGASLVDRIRSMDARELAAWTHGWTDAMAAQETSPIVRGVPRYRGMWSRKEQAACASSFERRAARYTAHEGAGGQ